MKLRKEYMLTRDIDWFCTDGTRLLHFASNGCILPNELREQRVLRRMQRMASFMREDDQREIHVEEEYIDLIVSETKQQKEEINIQSFQLFAKKGFYSYDWNWKLKQYVLVAKPNNESPNEFLGEFVQVNFDTYHEMLRNEYANVIDEENQVNEYNNIE